MPALRHIGTSTTASVSVIKDILSDKNTTKVTFFATARNPSGAYNPQNDGPDSNLPLVAALAEYSIPGFGPIWLVFDGLFLTYQRQPRIDEVDDVLNAAVASGRAHFSQSLAPFTTSVSADIAAGQLSALPSFPLTNLSIAAYTRLL